MTDIAFFRPDTDGRVIPLAASRSLWAPGTLNGPAICALAAHACESEFGDPGFRPARFTIDLFRAAREVPTGTRARLVRAGGRIQVVDVDIVQFADADDPASEHVVARSTTVFLRESQNPPGQRWQHAGETMSVAPPSLSPDDYTPRFSSGSAAGVGVSDVGVSGAGVSTAGEWQREMSLHQNGLRKRLWTRAVSAVAGQELTPFVRAMISAESTSLVCNWGSSGIGFINCDLTVTLSRLPRGDRIGVEADNHTEHDGISASTAGLYDVDGLWGFGVVTAVNNSAAEIDFTRADLQGRYREA